MDLPRAELQPNSYLRTRMQLVQDEDALYSTDIVGDIQGYIAAIQAIDLRLNAIDATDPLTNAIALISSEEIVGEQKLSYQSSDVSDPTAFLSRQRNQLMGKLFRDLDWSRPTFQSRYVRS